MTLLSYPIAADSGMLPDPTQVALLIDLMDGKKMAVFRWMISAWSGRATRRSLWILELAVALQIFVTVLW